MSKFLDLFYPRLIMSPDDDGGGAGGGDDKGDDADDKGGDDKGDGDKGKGGLIDKDKITGGDKEKADNDKKQGDDKDKKAADDKDKKIERPDWVAEKFWDPEKKEIRTEAMAKAYKDLESKLGKSTGKAPKSPDDYEIKLDDETKKALFTDGDAKKDPILAAVNKTLHEAGVPQELHEKLISTYAEAAKKFMKANAPPVIDEKVEKEKLGKNAEDIIENQTQFLSGLYKRGELNEDQLQEILILTETASGIQALQAIRSHYGEKQNIPLNLKPGGGVKSADELRGMMADKRYGNDKEYTDTVDREYEKKYGTGNSGHSQKAPL